MSLSEVPPGHNRGVCKDGGGDALARLSWSGRRGRGTDLVWDDGVVAGRQWLSGSGQEQSATVAHGGLVGSAINGGGGRWLLASGRGRSVVARSPLLLFSSSGSPLVTSLRWNRVLPVVIRQIW
jgi:hypothetical protein